MPILRKQWIKEYSIYPENYDLSSLMNFVDSTEMLFVRPLLGTELYDEIVEQIEEDEVSPENATLLTDGGLLTYAAQAFAIQTLPFAWGHISQTGITVGKSDNSESIDMKGITYMTSHLRSTVEEMKKNVFNWLSEREGSYPKWHPEDSCGCKRPSACGCEASFTEPQSRKIIYGLPRKNDELR